MRPPHHVILQLGGHRGLRLQQALQSPVRRAACRIPSRAIGSAPQRQLRRHETIELPVGLSGGVRLDVISPYIHTHTHAPATQPHEPRNIVVYLPRGPWISPSESTTTPTGASAQEQTQAYLQAALPPTTWLVTINYRIGPDQLHSSQVGRFPIPIHDVSTAFEFLTSSTSQFNHDYDCAPKICLLGSHIGGALATMLALTKPNDVHALATLEPMVDWVGLDEVVEQLLGAESRKRHTLRTAARYKYGVENGCVVAAAEELIKLRARLFDTPSAYFDPFASPLLFLRAPGRDTPLGNTVGDRMVTEMGLDQIDGGYREDHDGSALDDEAAREEAAAGAVLQGNAATATASSTTHKPPPRRRKVLHRWPATGNPESVLLPHVKVFVQGQPPAAGADDGLDGLGGLEGAAGAIATTAATLPRPGHAPGSDGKPPAGDVDLGLAALMRAQGSELAELMRRACFFGRERGFADERVLLHHWHDERRPSANTTMEKARLEPRRTSTSTSDSDSASDSHHMDAVHQESSTRATQADVTAPSNLRASAVQWIQEIFQQE